MISCSLRNGTTTIERQPSSRSASMWLSGGSSVEIGRLPHLAGDRGLADERVTQADLRLAQRLDECRARAMARAQRELAGRLLELEDRAAVRTRKLDRARDDRREHLIDVEARVDRLADLAERAQLVDRAAQLRAARGQLVEQLHVLDRDRALCGERRHQADRPLAERLDDGPPQHDHADDLVVGQHRDAEQRAEAAEVERLLPAVLGIVARVGELNRATFQPDATDDRAGAGDDRMRLQVGAVLGGAAEREHHAVLALLELVDQAAVRAAQVHGVTHDGVEHRLQLEVRAPDRLEHLGGGALLLDSVRQVGGEPIVVALW